MRKLACILGLCAAASAQVTVNVDAGTVRQTVDGFGISERLFIDPHVFGLFGAAPAQVVVPNNDQEEILDALFLPGVDGGMGLNHVIATPDITTQPGVEGSGDCTGCPYNFSDVRADGHIDLVNRMRGVSPLNGKQRGLTVWWMNYVQYENWMRPAGGGPPVIIDGTKYADYLLPIINRWRDRGAALTYVSPRNEPSSAGYTPDSNFIRDVIVRLVQTWGNRPTKIVAPTDDSCGASLNRIFPILGNSTAMSQLVAFTFHTYENPYSTGCADLRDTVAGTGKKFWMSEYYGVSGPPALPGDEFNFAAYMHDMFNNYDVGAIYYNYGFLGRNEASSLIELNNDGSNYFGYTLKKIYYVFGQFSKFILPGSDRIETSSSDSDIQVSAFKNGNSRVIVVTNMSGTAQTIAVNLSGSTGISAFRVTRTSATENWATLPDVPVSGSSFTATVSARSTETFVSVAGSTTFAISGQVRTAGGQGIDSVTVSLGGGPAVTTNSSGNYSATVNSGYSGTAAPSRTGYIFVPLSRTYSNVLGNVTGQDYVGSLLPSGSIANVRVLGATSTQAIIAYTVNTTSACTHEVSESATYSPAVNDVNTTLFVGSNIDGGGDSLRTFVVGKRIVAVAANSLKYSRALQAYTPHYFRITCGSAIATGRFQTANIPLGGTFMDALPGDPTGPGEYNWPTVSATDRTQRLIDPGTGLLVKRVGLRDDTDRAQDGTSGGSFDNCTINVDANGFRHCISRTSAGSNIMYAIHAGTGESRLLGTVHAFYPGGNQFLSMDNMNWDETDPNALYWLVLGTGYVLKGTYTGNDVPVAQGSGATPADVAMTWAVLSSNYQAALTAFRSDINTTDFPNCRMEGVQKRNTIIVCKHATLTGGYGGSQDRPAWITAFNLDANTVVAATQIGIVGSSLNNPAAGACVFHAYNCPGHLNGITAISLQIPTNGVEGFPCQRSDADHTGTTFVWKFLQDPNGTDTTGARSVLETVVTGAHEADRSPYKMMSETGDYVIVRNPSGGSVYDDMNNAQPTFLLTSAPTFSGVQAPGYFYQRHASLVPGLNGVSGSSQYGFDFTPLISQLASNTANVSGDVYKVTNATVSRKKLSTLATCDYKPMRDVSGPSAAFGALTSHTFCVAHRANECTSGSVAGDVYANCPAGGGAITVSDFPAVGQAALQIGLQPADLEDSGGTLRGFGRSRVLGNLFSRYKQYSDSNRFWSLKAFADNSWFFTPIFGLGTDADPYVPTGDPTHPLNSQRSDVFAVKLPPYPATDGFKRSEFIFISLQLKPPPALGANNVIVEFGYDSNLFCTSRSEVCVRGNHGGVDYAFAGDTITGLSCTSGCTIQIPVLSNHLLVYRYKYRNGSVTLRTSRTLYAKVP